MAQDDKRENYETGYLLKKTQKHFIGPKGFGIVLLTVLALGAGAWFFFWV